MCVYGCVDACIHLYMSMCMCERVRGCVCIGGQACTYACVGVRAMGVWVNVQCLCMRARVCVQTYIHESEQGASKEREPEGREEKTERESRLIRETRMSKGRNCQPGCETDSRLSSSGG